MNKAISVTEIESIINSLSKEKDSGPGKFTVEFYQIFKEEIILILHNLFQNIVAEGILLPHSMRSALS